MVDYLRNSDTTGGADRLLAVATVALVNIGRCTPTLVRSLAVGDPEKDAKIQ